ncbi:MAG: AraC family transcriptional regulator [Streptomyces sp.]|uniref:AraC family transcriptional regulator n=1 Tax=Streptomyces sp. TaxID=1931 RepID=UPI003D6B598C
MSSTGHHPGPYGGPGTAIVIGSFPLAGGSWFATHRHPVHQLAWPRSGLLRVRTEAGAWLLPPSLALWIPAGVPHATGAAGSAVMRSPYVAPERCPVPWAEPTVVAVSPLLRELIDHLDGADLPPDARIRAEAVLFDLLRPVPVTSISVPEPRDPRARMVARALAADPSDGRPLEEWGAEVGASARTLARLFTAETGLSFRRWREQVRMRAAMPLLAEGLTVESVARRIGYATGSAFVSAFHRTVGLTPRAYFPAP